MSNEDCVTNLSDGPYEYRAASAVIKWYHRDSVEAAVVDLVEVADSDSDRWVERRPRVTWERLP